MHLTQAFMGMQGLPSTQRAPKETVLRSDACLLLGLNSISYLRISLFVLCFLVFFCLFVSCQVTFGVVLVLVVCFFVCLFVCMFIKMQI